jgi:hypothetical protein
MNVMQLAHKFLGNELLPVADRLARANELFHILEYIDANMGFAHKYTYSSVAPTTANYEIGEGLAASVSQDVSVLKPLALRGTAIKIASDLLEEAYSVDELKRQKQEASIAQLARDYAYDFFYGEGGIGIEGLLSHADYQTLGYSCIGNDGTGGAYSSAWVINMGQPGSGGVYVATAPGAPAGITQTPFTEVVLPTVTGKEDTFLYSKIKIASQLIVENPRNVCRVANINTNESLTEANIDKLVSNLIKATNRPDQADKLVIVANKSVISMLECAKALERNVMYNPDQFGGTGIVKTFKGIPIAAVDQLVTSEAAVS